MGIRKEEWYIKMWTCFHLLAQFTYWELGTRRDTWWWMFLEANRCQKMTKRSEWWQNHESVPLYCAKKCIDRWSFVICVNQICEYDRVSKIYFNLLHFVSRASAGWFCCRWIRWTVGKLRVPINSIDQPHMYIYIYIYIYIYTYIYIYIYIYTYIYISPLTRCPCCKRGRRIYIYMWIQ